jgi:uncharacterized membrane protein
MQGKVALVLGMAAVAALPVAAAEEASAPAELGWLFLLLGLGAIVTIGFVMFAREQSSDQDNGASS